MTNLIIDGRSDDDIWQHLDDQELPANRAFSIPFKRWIDDHDTVIDHLDESHSSFGVRLSVSDEPLLLAHHLNRLSLIVVELESAADGRCYSIAARLREHLGFEGELRATGEVALDQLAFMLRCGFNAFSLPPAADMTNFTTRFSQFYQTGGPYDRGFTIREARSRRAAQTSSDVPPLGCQRADAAQTDQRCYEGAV